MFSSLLMRSGWCETQIPRQRGDRTVAGVAAATEAWLGRVRVGFDLVFESRLLSTEHVENVPGLERPQFSLTQKPECFRIPLPVDILLSARPILVLNDRRSRLPQRNLRGIH